ncbi:MAG TPA: aromatic amino acid lyase [Geminicoccaceae bacterium]|nr:aromatic amino acid lyase [Geminicoccaceae bacterium]
MTVVLRTRHDIRLEAARRVGWGGEAVEIAPEAVQRMAEARAAFERLIADPEVVVYGVTSGYGQRASVRVPLAERLRHARHPAATMQANTGEPFPERVARLMVLARLANFLEGHAAARPEVALAVAALLEGGPLPLVPREGAVSAGEILPLSWLFGPLIEGFEPREKEVLALVNGAPVAAALVADGALAAQGRVAAAEGVLALAAEAYKVPLGHFEPAVAALWGDPHELAAAEALSALIAGGMPERRPYQAPVSFRTLPKTLGRLRREAARAAETAAVSLAQVSDNPVFLPPDERHPDGRVLSTGGYHNAAAWPALHALAAIYADLCTVCDRMLARLLDGRTSGLPDQLQAGPDDERYLGTLGFAVVGYGEQARRAAQTVFLPGSDSGGFVQNDVSVPTALAWEGQETAGRMLDKALGAVAVVASQALHVTGRDPPPALAGRLAAIRKAAPPPAEVASPGVLAEAVAGRLWAEIYPGGVG